MLSNEKIKSFYACVSQSCNKFVIQCITSEKGGKIEIIKPKMVLFNLEIVSLILVVINAMISLMENFY